MPEWYKIVAVEQELLDGATTPTNFLTSHVMGGQAGVFYDPGEWAEAPAWLLQAGYGLCVFEDYDKAIAAFHLTGVTRELWRCQVDGVLPKLPPRMCLWQVSEGTLEDRSEYDWEDGTRMVKRAMLTERVSGYDEMFNPHSFDD